LHQRLTLRAAGIFSRAGVRHAQQLIALCAAKLNRHTVASGKTCVLAATIRSLSMVFANPS
jgi:hypothetical protein